METKGCTCGKVLSGVVRGVKGEIVQILCRRSIFFKKTYRAHISDLCRTSACESCGGPIIDDSVGDRQSIQKGSKVVFYALDANQVYIFALAPARPQ